LKKAGWLDSYETWTNAKNPLQQVLLQHKVNKSGDRLMVISTLGFINKLEDLNIVNYAVTNIRKGQTAEIFKELLSICSVGDKIASFFLRDVASVFELEPVLTASDYVYLQPVDTWVRQVLEKTGILAESYNDSKLKQLKQMVVDHCLKYNVSPIRFNQGAWYVGANAFDVLFERL